MWLIFALIGHIGNALVFLSDKASIEKRVFDPKALAFLAGASNIFTFVLIPWYLAPAASAVIISALLSGIFFVAGALLYFLALDQDETSRVVPTIGSMVPIFTFLLALAILSERLRGEILFAFILLMLGGILIELRSMVDFFSRRILTTFFLEIFAALLFAASTVFLKYAFNGTDNVSAFLWSRFGFMAASLPLLLFPSVRNQFYTARIHRGLRGSGGWFIGSRILGGIAPLILTTAVAWGSPTIVNALQGVQYGFLFILAIILSRRWPKIFGEEISRGVILQKSLATLLIIAGLYLLV